MSALTVNTWPLFYTSVGRTSTRVSWRDGMKLRDAIDLDWVERPALHIMLNGHRVEELDTPVWPEDMIDVSERPAEPGTALLISKVIVGSLFVGALSAILAPHKGPRKRDDEESAAYSFGGPANDRIEGQPIQYTYGGPIRSAGTIINEFTKEDATTLSTRSYQLICFGNGPIHSIGQYTSDNNVATPLSTDDPDNPVPEGTEINGNVATNFRRVNIHIRTGTQTQEPCPGFDRIATHYDVGQRLTQEETTTANNHGLNADLDPSLVAYNADGGAPTSGESIAAQAVWDAHGKSITTSEQHDAGTVVVSFPGGLYGTSSTTGALNEAGFSVAIRYKRVDALGNPINAGGDRGTGWVYVRPEPIQFRAQRQQGFRREYSWTFFDPLTYTAPTVGKCLDCSTSADYGATASLNTGDAPATWLPGQSPDGFTIECWAQFNNLAVAGVASAPRPLVNWWNGSSSTGTGFALGLESKGYSVNGTTRYRWAPVGYAGVSGGGTKKTIQEGNYFPHFVDDATVTPWYHFVFTYAKDPADQTGIAARYRLYINGVLIRQVAEASSTEQMAAPASASPLELCRSVTASPWGGSNDGLCFMDELVVRDRELSQAEIDASYVSGRGVHHTQTADMVLACHFNASGSPTADYSTYVNNVTLNGGATAGTTTGHVDAPGTEEPLVSRWLVQAVRLNLQSTSARIQDESVFDTFYGWLDRELAYPNLALASLEVLATDQLNTTRPSRSHIIKGRPCPTWDGVSVISPRITMQWTNNTAWVAVAVATEKQNPRRFTYSKIDWPAFKEFADYCDEFLYDGKGYIQVIDSASSAEPIADLRYDSTLFGGFGGIEILYRTDFRVPPHWVVGGFIQFDGLPTHANIDVDISAAGVQSGWEIGEIENLGGGNIVRIKYDTATYGDPWTDGLDWTTVTNPQALDGTIQGVEHRFEFDANYDTFGDFWDVLRAVLSTARAAPILEGDVLSVSYAHPRLPVALVTKASTMVDVDDQGNAVSSFKAKRTGKLGVPNMYEIQIFDRDRGYKDSPVRVLGDGLAPNAPAAVVVSKSMSLFGVVRRSQAVRLSKFELKVLDKQRTRGEFRCAIGKYHLNPDDRFILANDLMPWGKSGHVDSVPATNQIKLDRQIVIPASPTSYITVHVGALGQDDHGRDQTQTLAISSAAGTYAAGATLTLSGTWTSSPAPGDEYVLWQTQFVAEVVSKRPIGGHRWQFEWIEANDEVFDGVDTLTNELQPGGVSLGKG